FQLGSGTGNVNILQALSKGRLRFKGTVDPAHSTGSSIPIGTVRFVVIGANGAMTTTKTSLGSVTGTAATGNYAYLPRIVTQEGSFTVSGGGTGPTGVAVSGKVTSSAIGPINGARVSLGGGLTATTGADGSYRITNVAAGSYTASVASLPSNCTAPATI